MMPENENTENAATEAPATAEIQNAVVNEQPAIADTPSEAAQTQSAESGEPTQLRARGGRGGGRA